MGQRTHTTARRHAVPSRPGGGQVGQDIAEAPRPLSTHTRRLTEHRHTREGLGTIIKLEYRNRFVRFFFSSSFFFFAMFFFFIPFFFFFLFFFFDFFFLGPSTNFGINKRECFFFFFLFKNFFFLLSLWSSLVPRLAWGPTGCPIKKKKKNLTLCFKGGFHGLSSYTEAPHGISLPAPTRKQKNPLSFDFPPISFLLCTCSERPKKENSL